MAEQAKNLSFVLDSPLKVKYEDRPVPELKDPHDVIVQVAWTGICGSDVHYWLHGRIGSFILESPMVLGHESSGIVSSVGSAVKTLKPGDRVAMEPGVPCRHCPQCKVGFYNLCAEMAFASTPPFDGTLAKFYRLPADFCYKLPEKVSLEAGALVEPSAVAVHVVKQGGVKPGDSVVVFGAGPVGLLVAGVAKAFGALKVVLVDIQEARLDFAKEWVNGGVETFVAGKASAEENAKNIVEKHGLGEGADVVIDASGAEPSVQAGVRVVRRGGTYVQAGMGKDTVAFPILEVCTREVKVMGSFRYKEGDYDLAVKLIASGALDVEKLISKKVSFEEAEEAFGQVKLGKGIKFLIEGVKEGSKKEQLETEKPAAEEVKEEAKEEVKAREELTTETSSKPTEQAEPAPKEETSTTEAPPISSDAPPSESKPATTSTTEPTSSSSELAKPSEEPSTSTPDPAPALTTATSTIESAFAADKQEPTRETASDAATDADTAPKASEPAPSTDSGVTRETTSAAAIDTDATPKASEPAKSTESGVTRETTSEAALEK